MPPGNDPLSDVALAILAGGEGSRMGMPKAALRLGGRPILHFLLDRFDWPGPTLLVTAPGRERPAGYERFTRELVDPVAGEGPLRGLLTALENSPVPTVVVAAVDMPLVGRSQLSWLVAALQSQHDASGVMVVRTTGDGAPQVEPFPCAFRVAAAEIARLQRVQGRHAVHALASHLSIRTVPAPPDWPADTWTNLNRPQDLEAISRAMNRALDRAVDPPPR